MIDPSCFTSEIRNAAAKFGVLSAIHLDDFIFQFLITHLGFTTPGAAIDYYFTDGNRSAHRFDDLVTRFLVPAESGCQVLEFASGYGCVSRHLKRLGPRYRIVPCDIHLKAIRFLEQNLDLPAILSASDPAQFAVAKRFDVVFALSFFSHMPRTTWTPWLLRLLDHVRVGGLLIFTTHGRQSMKHFGDPVLGDDGFWFRAESEQRDLPVEEYGQTITLPRYVLAQVNELTPTDLVFFQEGLWWEHQDTYIVRRAS